MQEIHVHACCTGLQPPLSAAPSSQAGQCSLSLSLSLRFNGHFPGGPGLALPEYFHSEFCLELRVMEVVVTTVAVRCAKPQSNRHHQQTNTQFFYWPVALPVAQPTVSKHWRQGNCQCKTFLGHQRTSHQLWNSSIPNHGRHSSGSFTVKVHLYFHISFCRNPAHTLT